MYFAAKVNEEKCIGCKLCIISCPEPNVFTFSVECKKVSVNESRCKGCGLCVTICPKDTLTISQSGRAPER